MIPEEMRYTEQRYPFRGEGQEREEYEFFISGFSRPIVKRLGQCTLSICIISIL